jgi:general secretion pathway protein G
MASRSAQLAPPCSAVALDERRGEHGYSMLEILIVLAIMAVIASLVGPRLFAQFDNSKITAARTQVRTLEAALGTMRLDVGRYPTDQEGLALLVDRPSEESLRASWRGPYLDDALPVDPWGKPYRYGQAVDDIEGYESKPVIYSLGRDDAPGGQGPDADIGQVDRLASGLGNPG